MDINSLLSPDVSNPSASQSRSRSRSASKPPIPPPVQAVSPSASNSPSKKNPSPQRFPQRPSTQPRKSSQLSQQLTYSSDDAHPTAPTSPTKFSPKQRYPILGRMDALAEAASLAKKRPQTIMRQHEKNLSNSSHISSASSIDAVMPDAAPSPDTYDIASLPTSVSKDLLKWAKQVVENPFDITAHINLVQTLHQEFVTHVESGKPPHAFEAISVMRKARTAMNKLFPVGEDLWLDWLTDENLLSKSFEDRIAVMELHSQSIQEEPNSAPLWRKYGDYLYYLWSSSFSPDTSWSIEEIQSGQDIFTWDRMTSIWEQAVLKTQWHINDSNLVWDRYMEILLADQQRNPRQETINSIRENFIERLTSRAHQSWDETFQAFSQFVSAYEPSNRYEDIMKSISERSTKVKQVYHMREPYELKISQAQDKNDKNAEWTAYTEYLHWEMDNRGVFSMDLINGLFERATTRFPTDANIWIDYVELLIGTPIKGVPVLTILERATRHCPWSGDLWSHRILTMEAEEETFEEIEIVKHTATASGLVDTNGFEDLMKVYIAWCGYLRRRAFRTGASEDEVDMAEIGIRSSIEHSIQAGQKKYGKDFEGDPTYRLERIHQKFLYQKKDPDGVRSLFNGLISRTGDNYDFWYRYYIWAMINWGGETGDFKPSQLKPPREATNVLENALKRIETIDMPEYLVPMYLNHCEQHESVQYYRTALIKARQAYKKIESRRLKERESWMEQRQQQHLQPQQSEQPQQLSEQSLKRSRSLEVNENGNETSTTKKAKYSSDHMHIDEDHEEVEESTQPKRNRENTTLVVRNLPPNVTVLKLRQFFKDCGKIINVNIHEETGQPFAFVEFETKEDALYGQTKSIKPFDGNEISIEFSTGSTLWVTNYPPTADEKYLRNLFDQFGDIIEIRFPSLQANTHRRFCYVQFSTSHSAHKATSIDGTLLDGKYHLQVKISDPSRKDNRHGALAEGREIYVKNIAFSTTESEVKGLFKRFGSIEKTKIPTRPNGKGQGIAFVSFLLKEDAIKAAKELNNTPFNGRTISVEISLPKAKRSEILRSTPETKSHDFGLPGSSIDDQDPENKNFHERKECTVALMNIPDTVNVARIEKLVKDEGLLDIQKITLLPEHSGSLVELDTPSNAGKLSMKIAGKELDGYKIRVGTSEELRKEKAMVKADTLQKKSKLEKDNRFLPSSIIKRPGQKTKKRGGFSSSR